MLIQELKESIMNNTISLKYGNILIFTGDESYLQELYIKQLAKKNFSKINYVDDFFQIKKSLTTNTIFDNKGIFVLRNYNQFIKDDELFKSVIPASNKYLILIYDKLDKRKPFYKNNQNIICNFEKMPTKTLINIIQKKYNLNDNNCKTLCELVDNDYGRLLLELDKLNLLFKNIDDVDKVFIDALDDGIIYQEITDKSFNLLDAILTKDTKLTFYYLKQLEQYDSDCFKMLGLLYSNFKNMLLLKANYNININSFIKSKLTKILPYYKENQIINDLKIIQDTEQGIKSGKIDSDIALLITIIRLLYEGDDK